MSNPHSKAKSVGRVDYNNGRSSAVFGRVYWSPAKSLWTITLYAGALLGGYATFGWDALLLCLGTTLVTLWAGYSVGIHRRLIHRSFQCPQRLENLLVYLGILTGIGGPFSIMSRHDMRDWAQRQPRAHEYYTSRQNIFTDWYWWLHCNIRLDYPPIINYEPRIAQNRFYQWLEQTWMFQQVPWAIAFYHFGGWSWVFWGIYVRVAVSITAHWLLEYLTHHVGTRPYWIKGATIQHRNIPLLGLFTFGECWKNNHQAFPSSALFGTNAKQLDPSWWLIKAFDTIGLAWNIKRPKHHLLKRVQRPIPQTTGTERTGITQSVVVQAAVPSSTVQSTVAAGEARQKVTTL